MEVDTGSNGVVVARKYLGPSVHSLSPRQYFTGFSYSSSGNSYSGEWVQTQLTLTSSAGGTGSVTTAPMLVRAADKMCDKAGKCTSGQDVGVAMLGVGFDRASDRTAAPANSGPGINPFLNVEQMVSGTMRQAYSFGSGQLTLGVSTQDLAGYRQVALQRTTGGQPVDWMAPTACVQVVGSVPPQCGSLLLDTGLAYAILQVPNGQEPPTSGPAPGNDRRLVANGQRIQVTIPTLGSSPFYAFAVGGSGAPRQVQWGHLLSNGQPFFNISRFALSQTDYLYDSTDGRIGLRPST